MSDVKNPAFSMVFHPDYRALFENKERAIKPFGLSLENHLENVRFTQEIMAQYTIMD